MRLYMRKIKHWKYVAYYYSHTEIDEMATSKLVLFSLAHTIALLVKRNTSEIKSAVKFVALYAFVINYLT